MTSAEVEQLAADPAVEGLILTGSHARGTATVHSDRDLVMIGPAHYARRTATLDVAVVTIEDLADTSDIWQRYAFRGAKTLVDRRSGQITDLVHRQATPTAQEAVTWAREGLDGYVNFLYRAAKSRRDDEHVAARLDEAESVSWLLLTVFALHGRVRPYNKYLRWELETYPLDPPWDATLPERAVANPASLFPAVEALARDQGHGDILDAWGDDLTLLR
ncbi:hypothetical protein GCM10010435_02690 [Winogradskya consettensis]|uniref:Polymerase nucleotidyl transferase domain-containing protein n=1 Tax=Winogradskya consettensis TaxID=113560 RepID=A0A919S6X5_9ACTN|nr:nucleotidyltransferase domain-containing protein [Actinoplanes consettensis]GIM66058.1 hypothetical protein Aco04nite_00260 [Actinoplanes consettensis]